MTTPDLIKLAPTLSVEERYKIIIPDCFRMLRGEESVLSESEVVALTSFEKNAVWEQYALHVAMFKWAHILWVRDIQSEKFGACTAILLLNDALWRMIGDMDDGMEKEAVTDDRATLRKYVSVLQKKLPGFYAYREAILRLQEELYGVPIFDGEQAETIQGFFAFVGDMVKRHNDTVQMLCTDKKIKGHFKAIADDIDHYLVAEPKPEEVAIAELVDEVRSYAQSDVNARLGR